MKPKWKYIELWLEGLKLNKTWVQCHISSYGLGSANLKLGIKLTNSMVKSNTLRAWDKLHLHLEILKDGYP